MIGKSSLAIVQEDVDGATLLVIEDHSLPVVRFLVTLRPGAESDPSGQAGLTRVLMDLSLRGTTTDDRQAFNAKLEEMGSHLSAVTGTEAAMWRGITLRRHLDPTLALLADAMARPALQPDEMTPLVEEIVEGLRADRDDDETLAEIFLRRSLYEGHRLGRSPQGEIPDLQGLASDAVTAAFRERLRPGAVVAAFAGDLSVAEARAALQRLVADLPKGAPVTSTLAPLPRPRGVKVVIVDKPERTQVQLRLARPALSGRDADALAFWLGVMAFGGTFTAPLLHEVRDVRGWSYTAHAGFDRLGRLVAPMVFRSAPGLEVALDCVALELDLYRKLAAGELASEAIELARSYVLNRYPLEIATSSDLLMAALRHQLIGQEPEEVFQIPARLAAIQIADVGAALRRTLDPAGVVVVMVATASAIEPAVRARFPEAEVRVVDFAEGLGLNRS
ncbi:MAG: insulinase family protein [Deltaproteobacteria bacterium]|nr:insulinase family protein [Deltaproteobacteria bacterium]